MNEAIFQVRRCESRHFPPFIHSSHNFLYYFSQVHKAFKTGLSPFKQTYAEFLDRDRKGSERPPGAGRLIAIQMWSYQTAINTLKHTEALSVILLIQSPSKILFSNPLYHHELVLSKALNHYDPSKTSWTTTSLHMPTSSLTPPIISNFLQLISEELLEKDGAITP